MKAAYVIGFDFGTDSLRGVLYGTGANEEIASASCYYPQWSEGKYCSPSESIYRQHPSDYRYCLEQVLSDILSKVDESIRQSVIGIGVGATSSTIAPINPQGTVLSELPKFSCNPNAMFNVWKDHSSIEEADRIKNYILENGLPYLKHTGDDYSSEWAWAKILNMMKHDNDVFQETYLWIELCDWIVSILTGTHPLQIKKSQTAAGYKAMWNQEWNGYPPNSVFAGINKMLDGMVSRFSSDAYCAGDSAGTIDKNLAHRYGLSEDVVISVGSLDANMGAVGLGITPGNIYVTLGTSGNYLAVQKTRNNHPLVPGICAQLDGSILPGYFGYEAVQPGFGDVFKWFNDFFKEMINQIIPNAETASVSVLPHIEDALMKRRSHELPALREKEIPTALDWFNGRATPYIDEKVGGGILGLRINTSADEVYQALVFGVLYGAKRIIEHYEEYGIPANSIISLGGIAQKSQYVMQNFSDILNKPIHVAESKETCAFGAAICGAAAAGWYSSLQAAQDKMVNFRYTTYYPDEPWVQYHKGGYARYKRFAQFASENV